MKPTILDASAVLALLNQEPGYQMVEKFLPESVISTVNLSEVIAVLTEIGMRHEEARDIVSALIKEKIPFDEEQAHEAGSLR
jgi:PIN domain nuclease of toxin-antitoxin system